MDQAENNYDECLAVCHAHGLHRQDAEYLSGFLALIQGNKDKAEKRFKHLLQAWQKNPEKSKAILLLAGLAAVAAQNGQSERAMILSTAAQKILESIKDNFQVEKTDEFNKMILIASEKISDIDASSSALGHALTIDQAIAFALEQEDI